MNKKLIQELLDDDETRDQIALMVNDVGTSPEFRYIVMQDILRKALNILNDTPVKGEIITIEVLDHMWVRGEYVCTEPDGRLLVSIPGKNPGSCVANEELYAGKRVDLIVKGEEGGGKPDLVGTGVQKGIVP